MVLHLSFGSVATTFLIIIIPVFVIYRLRGLQASKRPSEPDLASNVTEPARLLCENLVSALPDGVVLTQNTDAFRQSMKAYWAQQEREAIPACVIRPRNVQHISTAITLLKREYNGSRSGGAITPFAIRSGGHSPVSGAASVNGGILIDLSLFCEVTPSEDESNVVIGVGAKWRDVSKVLDEKGLAVLGGRNSAVGVGGLTLGGGLSFFSPQFGFVCSNVLSYEIVLASGSVTTASKSCNTDLWRALKGGSNNFGIVTRMTAPSFPSAKIWSGFLYMLPRQAPKVLAAFHEYVNRAYSDPLYDSYAAGPLACFTYVSKLGFQVISVNLVHTKPPVGKWPPCWQTSSFQPLWRLWSTCKVRTLTSATDEMDALDPHGRRQAFGTTTIRNDPATIAFAHAAYHDAIASIRRSNIKDLTWSLVLQPLLPEWARKGDPNPLGLHEGDDKPLVIVSFTVHWTERQDDKFAEMAIRDAIERIDAFAVANKTDHRFRYLNYCGSWQRPFDGYGPENLRFLREVSKRYDPDGFFQKACAGGFKLDIAGNKV